MKKIVFLFPTNRCQLLDEVQKNVAPDNNLYGMNHLSLKDKVEEVAVSETRERWLNLLLLPVAYFFNSSHTKLNLVRVLLALPRLNQVDVVITCVDSINRAAALLRQLGLLRTPLICTAGNVLDGSEHFRRLHRWLWSGADAIITHAPVDQKKLVRLKLGHLGRMIPVGSDRKFYQAKKDPILPQRKGSDPKMILAVGADRDRDYQTLFSAAQKLNQLKFQVFTRPSCVKGLKVPQNVSLYLDADFLETRQAMKKAAVIVVPVKETDRASGQLALLDAMLMKKAVVVSNVVGLVKTYGLENDRNCVIVAPENGKKLAAAIAGLVKKEKKKKVTSQAGQRLALRYTTKQYAKKLERVIKIVNRRPDQVNFNVDRSKEPLSLE